MSVHGPLGATQSGAFELGRARPRLPAAARRARAPGLLGLSGLLLTGLVISSRPRRHRLAAARVGPPGARAGWRARSAAPASASASPALIGVLTLMFVSYASPCAPPTGCPARTVLMCIAALHALVLLAPPLLSTDVFSYQAYARMGAHVRRQPVPARARTRSRSIRCTRSSAPSGSRRPTVYGPVFTLLSYCSAPLSIAASVLAYKAIAALASLAIVALVWNAARLRGVDPVKAVALVGLNPLLVVYGVGGGHNDLLMLALLARAGISLLAHRERRRRLAGARRRRQADRRAVLPFALAGAGGRLSRSRRRDVADRRGDRPPRSIAALGFAVFGTGPLHLLAHVSAEPERGRLAQHPRLHHDPPRAWRRSATSTGLVLAVVFVGVFCWLVRRVWRGELDWIDGAGWATVAMLVAASCAAAVVRGLADAAGRAGHRPAAVADRAR